MTNSILLAFLHLIDVRSDEQDKILHLPVYFVKNPRATDRVEVHEDTWCKIMLIFPIYQQASSLSLVLHDRTAAPVSVSHHPLKES